MSRVPAWESAPKMALKLVIVYLIATLGPLHVGLGEFIVFVFQDRREQFGRRHPLHLGNVLVADDVVVDMDEGIIEEHLGQGSVWFKVFQNSILHR